MNPNFTTYKLYEQVTFLLGVFSLLYKTSSRPAGNPIESLLRPNKKRHTKGKLLMLLLQLLVY